MPMRTSALRRGTERGRAIVHDLVREAEAARVANGTSYAAIAAALGMGGGQVARILRGRSPDLSIVRASQVLAVLGLDLSARAFPVGPAIRDRAQLALIERFRARLPPELPWRVEVPVQEIAVVGEVDHRAWDAGIDAGGWRARIDAETHLGDLQAVQRRIALKQRDGREACVILLLSDTRHHRDVVRAASAGLLAQFPVSQRRAMAALSRGRCPPGNAIVLL